MSVVTDEQLELDYNEYLEETDDVKVMSWHQFKAKRTVMFSNLLVEKDVVVKPLTKAAISKQIFNDGKRDGLSRKDIIELFMLEATLTKAGAATYYANLMVQYNHDRLVIKSDMDVVVSDNNESEVLSQVA